MDAKTLAYINMYAILGALKYLCEESAEARKILGDSCIDLGIAVKNGPEAMLRFEDGTVRVLQGTDGCDILLRFSSPEKFNGMIDGTVTPIPSKGFTKIGFLLKKFTKLTDLLSAYLRATKEDLQDEEFFRISTTLMFHVILESIAQIGNHDRIGRFSADWTVDGNVRLAILPDGIEGYVAVKDHRLTAVHEKTEDVMSSMEFIDMKNARVLFDGEMGSFPLICDGKLRMKGMISQLANINRMLGRVAVYLA